MNPYSLLPFIVHDTCTFLLDVTSVRHDSHVSFLSFLVIILSLIVLNAAISTAVLTAGLVFCRVAWWRWTQRLIIIAEVGYRLYSSHGHNEITLSYSPRQNWKSFQTRREARRRRHVLVCGKHCSCPNDQSSDPASPDLIHLRYSRINNPLVLVITFL